MEYLKIENLSHRYSKSEDILKNVDLAFNRGEITAILGESGSGKSTLLRNIIGLEEPFEGKISLNGEILSEGNNSIPTEKREIGMVFQDYALFPHLTVEKNISFGLKEKKKEAKARVEELLKLIKLSDYGKRYPYELSGGQQQRIALARTIAPSPKLVLLDEPFSNLDANLQEKIRNDLNSILRKSKETAIFVTHDKDDLDIADRVVVMDGGRIIQVGTPKEVFENPVNDYVAHLLGK